MLSEGTNSQLGGPMPRNLVTAKGNIRCRFDLFVRFPPGANRTINPFTYRGDAFGIAEPEKMLGSLLKNFIKNHTKWILAELYDNTHPLNDRKRLILEYKNGVIVTSRLRDYEDMLQQVALPEWLKS